MRLVKWQRNAIFEAVKSGGLDARECTFDYDDARARITHVPSDSYFLLEGDPGHYVATAFVGEEQDPPWSSDAFTWPTVEERVETWSLKVKNDIDTPDLWAEIQREREILTGARYEDVENTPFTSDERAEIAEQLHQLKEFVAEKYSLSEAQMLSLESQLDYIEAAAGRIGRKDWLLLVCGVMFTLIVTGLLPPDVVRHILAMLLHGLDQLIGGWGRPELLPP